MTVMSIYAPVNRMGNGATVIFAFPYQFFAPSDLKVSLFDMVGNTGVAPPPALNGAGAFDYTVSGTIDTLGTGEYLNGSVTFHSPPPANVQVIIERSIAPFQPVALADDSLFPAKTVEAEFDRLQMQIQQNAATLGRAITVPASDPPGLDLELPPAALRAGKMLGFDGQGSPETSVSTGDVLNAIAGFYAGAIPIMPNAGWAATLAAAKALYSAGVLLAHGQALVVASRFTLTDGYGGVFVYKSGDTTTVFAQDGLGFVDNQGRRFFRLYDAAVSVKWFGAVGDGAANDSVAVQAAFDSGRSLFIPAGRYLVNVNATSRVRVIGEGSVSSVLKPFNAALAAVTLTVQTGDWPMAYVFEGLGFEGTAKTGVGVAFGKTDPAAYVVNDEYIGRVTFNNCYFSYLAKGIQRTYGNLGLYLNQCGFATCAYGSYSLNAKFGGDMHAGCFYCLGGSTMGCDCGHYFFNDIGSGFGGVAFDGHVFEENLIGVYGLAMGVSSPFSFKSYWNEAQGALKPGAPATVGVDAWTGTVRSTLTLEPHAFIFDGRYVAANFRDGAFSDVWLKAADSIVISEGDRFESTTGYGGAPCAVSDPLTSRIIIRDAALKEGGANVSGVMMEGANTQAFGDFGSVGASGRSNIIPFRTTLVTLFNVAGFTNACNTVAGGAADFVPGATTIPASAVIDGSFYANAAEYASNLTTAQFVRLANSGGVLSAGWWAWSMDCRLISGLCRFIVFDLASNILGNYIPPADGAWHCVGGLGHLASGNPNVNLWLTGTSALGQSFTFRLRNYQLRKFATRYEAQDFLRAQIFGA